MARLVDAVGAAGERRTNAFCPGPVDAAEPEDGDRRAALPAERLPLQFGIDTRGAARVRRNGSARSRRSRRRRDRRRRRARTDRRSIAAWAPTRCRMRASRASDRRPRRARPKSGEAGAGDASRNSGDGWMPSKTSISAPAQRPFVGRTRRADHAVETRSEFGDVKPRAITEAEAEERGHSDLIIRCARCRRRRSPWSSARCPWR